jgi:WD40 repeat protein/energy-coupling factor transporter ATP-binding protein EcfA2
MMQENTICPYPGLRPFNEDESIFFKGREEHIEKIISLLEKNKFLMLTGASGDGKSSLVYAGLVPNARAGFFKAKYNNWLVADFRPERAPLKNLAKSLATRLKLDADYVEKEIGYGFSSLINLYKSTPFHIDTTTDEWQTADDKGKRVLKRKGANLLILVDQFEEFFTNPENYTEGKPSVQAQAVINLLLETAKLALKNDLPIYIICTMRSDYIGQCADFRGLPEFIGFSQFFVPRLKRKEIHQVIEEPATLSGNKISNRLTETLINELVYGLDQLPVLQHALNQIWNIAHTGHEMDLIHLAKLAGISKEVLPEKDKQDFNTWFTSVPQYKKGFYSQPGLNNVLNAHANELFEKSTEYYNTKYTKNVSQETAHLVIKTAFQCLTKIDDSRAVRNRMTLEEITYLIDKPEITIDVVAGLLELFRMQGNTFLKPFITDDPATIALKNEDVLDITHESLIRNWDLLKLWAEEENENRQVYLDFYKQLERWVASGRSHDYLLASGPLSFFTEWHNKCRPSKYWLLKYDESDKPVSEKLTIADATIKDIKRFLSSSKKAIARTRNIAIAAATVVFVFLSAFTIWAMMERHNALLQKEIADKKTQEAIASEKEAQLSKIAALESKTKAEESEVKALTAKENALKAQQEALIAKAIADRERIKADEQKSLAVGESKRADEQRKIADEARDKAIAAEQKAKRLTLISVAQSLALKSTIIEGDADLRALLAVQAYNLTLQNNENTQQPIIFEALRSAYTNLKPNNTSVIKGLNYEPRTLSLTNSGKEIIASGKSDLIYLVNTESGSVSKTYTINHKKNMVYTLLSTDSKKLLCGYEDGEIALWDLSNPDQIAKTTVSTGKQQLTSAIFSASKNVLVTATSDKTISMWNISSGKVELISATATNSIVRSLAISNDEKKIFYATETGDISTIKLSDQTTSTIFFSKSTPALCLNYNKERNQLAAGFTDGKIRLFDLEDNSFRIMKDHISRVESIIYNPSGDLLASSGSDKTIRIYNLKQQEAKPIVLKNATKARSIIFINNHILAAGMADKTIYSWELSSEKIVESICPVINRNLTKTEWEQYVGSGVEYQKICK